MTSVPFVLRHTIRSNKKTRSDRPRMDCISLMLRHLSFASLLLPCLDVHCAMYDYFLCSRCRGLIHLLIDIRLDHYMNSSISKRVHLCTNPSSLNIDGACFTGASRRACMGVHESTWYTDDPVLREWMVDGPMNPESFSWIIMDLSEMKLIF